MTKEELWQIVLAEIELGISKANFVTWFRNTSILSKKNGVVSLGVPNGFTKEWLENKYNTSILKALKHASPDTKRVEYVIRNAQAYTQVRPKNGKPQESLPSDLVKSKQEYQLRFEEVKIDKETNLNKRYVFENFVVGASNELAHAAAMSIVKNPGTSYNPLFIYGGVGLGKTHLLQAIGNEVVKRNPKKRVSYIASEKFTSELIASIYNKTVQNFKERYRHVDVLIIDDVQFLAGKEKTQEEFFHTFNSLYEKNKQIILSSDRPPKSIATLEERLRSRFEGGMMADIGVPDLETRIAILKTKAEERSFVLSDESIEYIAVNIQKNIRELEGALNRIALTKKAGEGEIVDIDVVKKVLDSLLFNTRKITSYKQVVKAVAEFYEINEKELIEKNRRKEVVHPRQITMYLLRKELSCSFPFIGAKLGGRDHTTVMHACGKIEKELKQNEDVLEEIRLIKERLQMVG